ncbi:MAG: 50S ribosomal protein L23 [Myxococcota bacterium]|nr:50S ribosomal protein L23 [Myxococcota bacterium]
MSEYSTELYDVLRRPLLTEKGQHLRDSQDQYLFEVAMDANKIQIKSAVEKLFGVRVEKVNTLVMRGKVKRVGRFVGKRANWKKAVVTLREGDFIDLFEGA